MEVLRGDARKVEGTSRREEEEEEEADAGGERRGSRSATHFT